MNDYNREMQERNYCVVWSCPQCDYSYESEPNCNEAQPCPECGAICRDSGGSYDA